MSFNSHTGVFAGAHVLNLSLDEILHSVRNYQKTPLLLSRSLDLQLDLRNPSSDLLPSCDQMISVLILYPRRIRSLQ